MCEHLWSLCCVEPSLTNDASMRKAPVGMVNSCGLGYCDRSLYCRHQHLVAGNIRLFFIREQGVCLLWVCRVFVLEENSAPHPPIGGRHERVPHCHMGIAKWCRGVITGYDFQKL